MKKCNRCDLEKPTEQFHRDKTRKDGLRGICKTCVTGYMQGYYAMNKPKVIQRVLDWVAGNREAHNAKCARWVRLNRGKVNARTARRYAAKTKATPAWVLNDADMLWMINEIYDLAKHRSAVTKIQWEVDHIVPLRGANVCGLHTPFNLRVVLSAENRRKSNTFEVAS